MTPKESRQKTARDAWMYHPYLEEAKKAGRHLLPHIDNGNWESFSPDQRESIMSAITRNKEMMK